MPLSVKPELFNIARRKLPGAMTMPVNVPYIFVVDATAGIPPVAQGGKDGVILAGVPGVPGGTVVPPPPAPIGGVSPGPFGP